MKMKSRKENCEVEEKDCKSCQMCPGYVEAEDKMADISVENKINTVDGQTKDYGENVINDEDFLKNEVYDFLQKNGFIESGVEFSNDNVSAEEAIDEDINITQEDGNIKDDNKLEANLLSKEQTEVRNEDNTLHEEKNKVSAIDILSKLKEISKLK